MEALQHLELAAVQAPAAAESGGLEFFLETRDPLRGRGRVAMLAPEQFPLGEPTGQSFRAAVAGLPGELSGVQPPGTALNHGRQRFGAGLHLVVPAGQEGRAQQGADLRLADAVRIDPEQRQGVGDQRPARQGRAQGDVPGLVAVARQRESTGVEHLPEGALDLAQAFAQAGHDDRDALPGIFLQALAGPARGGEDFVVFLGVSRHAGERSAFRRRRLALDAGAGRFGGLENDALQGRHRQLEARQADGAGQGNLAVLDQGRQAAGESPFIDQFPLLAQL